MITTTRQMAGWHVIELGFHLDFVTRAWLGGMLLALLAGPLGSLIIWRKMAYFGDTLAHSAMLGVALAVATQTDAHVGILVVGGLVCACWVKLAQRSLLTSDAILGILSHSTLAIGLIVLAAMRPSQLNLMGLLLGDILALNATDLIWIGATVLLTLGLLGRHWNRLVAMTVASDIATVEAGPQTVLSWQLMGLLSLVFAVTIKLVGVLLITAMLVVPAAAARQLATSPEQMVVGATGCGILAVTLGLGGSFYLDWPTGPSIVAAAAAIFVILYQVGARSKRAS